jgi:hypothetical protein
MARIFKDSSVLNQFGSPSLNSNTLANRPAFGQVGRLFVDTTNNVFYRDTGTSWVIVGGSGSTPNLQTVTGVGNTSSNGIFLGLVGSLSPGLQFEVSGYSRFSQTVGSASDLGSNVNQYFTLQTNGTPILTGAPSPAYSQLYIDIQADQSIGGAGNCQIGSGLFENVISGIDNLGVTISQTVGISALSPIISYQRYINTGDSYITHNAGLVINGLQNTGTGVLTITNNYQLLINSSEQFANTALITNRWGIYQAGVNDKNLFAAFIYQGNTASDWISLQNNAIYGRVGAGLNNFYLINYSTVISHNGNDSWFSQNGNLVLGSSAVDSGRKLQVNGNIEVITTTATGVHTPTAQHLPIYVNGTLYYLQLLN